MISATHYELHGRELPADTLKILDLTAERTGKGFEFRPQRFELADSWASVKVATREAPNHTILYHPDYGQHLGYLVAHECGHVLRLYGVPESERKLPAVTRQHHRSMVYELQDHLLGFVRLGLRPEQVGELAAMWHGGLIRQLANAPVDARIERWLREEYSGLRDKQETAVAAQMLENVKTLSRSIERSTPPKVFYANNAMNAAYARYIGRTFEDQRYFDPYRGGKFEKIGRRLGDELWETADGGYHGDVRTVEKWSKRFGLDRWWEWRPMQAQP